MKPIWVKLEEPTRDGNVAFGLEAKYRGSLQEFCVLKNTNRHVYIYIYIYINKYVYVYIIYVYIYKYVYVDVYI